ncbi:MAG: MltA domain-containing protein [Thiolinea sp.]
MDNKKRAATILVTSSLMLSTVNADYHSYPELQPVSEIHNTALPWWNERNVMPPTLQPYSNGNQQFAAPRHNTQNLYQPKVRVQPANYKKNPALTLRKALNCQHFNALNLPDHCIQKSHYNRKGLLEQVKFLRTRNPKQRVAGKWANISNAALLQTAHELLNWEQGFDARSFREKFSLREIGSYRSASNTDYTGYFTPVLQVKRSPDQYYRFPVYAPPRNGTRFSRKEIDHGALNGQGLEIAWTNDKINLFFAQTQGSAIARYPDGTERYLRYAANNNHSYGKISRVLRDRGYMRGGLSNANIRRWLHANPHKIDEVLHKNPRYIFFSISDRHPRTATGSAVIPGHTLAVDDNFIPLGAVLLAEIPRIDHLGKRIGSDWRLLFAQDRGNAIKGPGRVDIYTGMGEHAEQKTYHVTGLHRTYLLVRKSGYLNNNVAGM